MSSGLPNKEKVRVRQLYAEGKADRLALLEAEAASYHGIGTCTFYGTANTNQMVMEVMGLHLPGASFVHPDTLRDALNDAAARQVTRLTDTAGNYLPIGRLMDEKVVVNGIVSLLATGGSTNLTMHLVAMARAAGIIITWDDFSELSEVVPLLCRIYRTARPTSTSSRPPAACRWWCASCCNTGCCTKTCTPWPVSACTATPRNPGWIMASWRGAKAWPARSTPA